MSPAVPAAVAALSAISLASSSAIVPGDGGRIKSPISAWTVPTYPGDTYQ